MDKKKVGEFLASKRHQLGFNPGQMAKRANCNRTTIERMEKGMSRIPRSKVAVLAQAYEIEVSELCTLCGYPVINASAGTDSEITASIADLEFLIEVSRGLKKPITLTMISEILKRRV